MRYVDTERFENADRPRFLPLQEKACIGGARPLARRGLNDGGRMQLGC